MRRFRRVAAGILLLFLFLAAFHAFALPAIVESRARAALAEAGFPDARFTVGRITLSSAEFADVRLDREGLATAERITIRFRPSDLLAGRVREIEVGAPVIRFAGGASPFEAVSAGDEDPDEPPGEWPVERIVARAGRFVLQDGSASWSVPFSGRAVRGDGRLRVDAEARVEGSTIALTADLDPRDFRSGVSIRVAASVAQFDEILLGRRVELHKARLVGECALGDGGVVRARIRLSAERAAIDGAAATGVSLAVDPRAGGGHRVSVALRAADLEGRIAADLPALTLDGPLAGSELRVEHLSFGAWSMAGARIRLDGDTAFSAERIAGPGALVLHDVEGRAPTGGGAGEVAVGRVAWGASEFAGPTLILARLRRGLAFSGAWRPGGGAELATEGELSLGPDGMEGWAVAQIPPFSLSPGDPPGRAITAATGLAVSGRLSAEAEVLLSAGRVDPQIRITADGASLESVGGDLVIEGLEADLVAESLSPLVTESGRTVAFRRLRVGDLEFLDGVVRGAVEGPDSVLIERADGRLPDGARITTSAFRFNPDLPVIDVELFAEDLSLAAWLPIATDGRADGEGTLHGRLAVAVRTAPRLSIAFGEGSFHARGGGVIRVHDAERLRELLEENRPAGVEDAAYTDLVKERIVSALRAFAFDALRFDVVRRDGELVLTTHVAGRGARPPHQELSLTINVRGFADLVGPALALQAGLDRARASLERRGNDR